MAAELTGVHHPMAQRKVSVMDRGDDITAECSAEQDGAGSLMGNREEPSPTSIAEILPVTSVSNRPMNPELRELTKSFLDFDACGIGASQKFTFSSADLADFSKGAADLDLGAALGRDVDLDLDEFYAAAPELKRRVLSSDSEDENESQRERLALIGSDENGFQILAPLERADHSLVRADRTRERGQVSFADQFFASDPSDAEDLGRRSASSSEFSGAGAGAGLAVVAGLADEREPVSVRQRANSFNSAAHRVADLNDASDLDEDNEIAGLMSGLGIGQ